MLGYVLRGQPTVNLQMSFSIKSVISVMSVMSVIFIRTCCFRINFIFVTVIILSQMVLRRRRQSTGIIGWLEVIESGLSTTLTETTATEKSAVVMQQQAPKVQRCRKLGHPTPIQ